MCHITVFIMKKILTFLFIVALSSTYAFAQTENVGINTTSPDNSAALHITYVTTPKGVLVPRMTTTERGNIPSPANGLLIYNTDNSRFEVYNSISASWQGLLTNTNVSTVAWARTGNAGTNPGTDFLGTTDNKAFTLFTNNSERLRIDANGNIGIGSISPTALLSVGTSNQFQVSGTGAINAATGITSSGNILFSGLNANEFVRTIAGGQLSTYTFSQDLSALNDGTATVTGLQGRALSSTAPTNGQVLQWNNTLSQWEPATISGGGSGNTLDGAYDQGGAGAGRQINVTDGAVQLTSTNASDEALEIKNSGNGGVLFLENTGTGKALVVNDEASDTTPFTIDANGNVGVMTNSPSAAFDVDSTFKLGNNGTVHSYIISDTVSIDLPSINAADSHQEFVTVSGAQQGSTVIVTPANNLGDDIVIAYARVTASDTVAIKFVNVRDASNTADYSAIDFYITVIK